jgi:hypothetical protein
MSNRIESYPQEEDPMDGMAADDASPASAVRERYERMFKEKQRGSKGSAAAGDPAATALAAQGQAVRTAFQGSISSVFTKHLRQGGICYCCFVCCLPGKLQPIRGEMLPPPLPSQIPGKS